LLALRNKIARNARAERRRKMTLEAEEGYSPDLNITPIPSETYEQPIEPEYEHTFTQTLPQYETTVDIEHEHEHEHDHPIEDTHHIDPHAPIQTYSEAYRKRTKTISEVITKEQFRILLRPAMAELIGSALFVFIACGCAMTTTGYKNVGTSVIGISLTFGFCIFVFAYAIGHVSGGHLNCAVTFALCMLRRISIFKGKYRFLLSFFS
jgi:hypothetical protein